MTDRAPYPQSPVVDLEGTDARPLRGGSLPPEEPRALDPLLGPAKRPEFRAIFDTECGYVWKTLRRLGVQERDLEDLAHDVFVVVYKRLDTYDPTRPLKPWLFGISFRVASDYRRLARHRRERITEDAAETEDDSPGADDRIESEQSRRLVLEGLESLDLDRRAVFVMHELDGHPIPAIAAALGIPVNTAYSRLRLAREQFAAAVKRIQLRADTRARASRGTP